MAVAVAYLAKPLKQRTLYVGLARTVYIYTSYVTVYLVIYQRWSSEAPNRGTLGIWLEYCAGTGYFQA